MTLSKTVANIGQDEKIAEAFPNCDERQKGIALQILHPKTDCQLEKEKQTLRKLLVPPDFQSSL